MAVIEVHPMLLISVIGLLVVALFLLEKEILPNYDPQAQMSNAYPFHPRYMEGFLAGQQAVRRVEAERLAVRRERYAFGWDDPIKQYNHLEKENVNDQK
jgi:hypothetical protein